MLDETGYKIAIAAFLHDIGKFAERAEGKFGDSEKGIAAYYPDAEFLDRNRALYQPLYKGHYTHKHAVFTAAFLDDMEKVLPGIFNKGEWGLGDSFMNLAAGHHNPDTPLQWIIAIADRVSSGFDRNEFEERYNVLSEVANYKKVRLVPILEQLSVKKNKKTDFSSRYSLAELSPTNIFPVIQDSAIPETNEKAGEEYRNLFEDFIYSLEKLSRGGHIDNIPLWFEHFDSLFMIYASHIPASTVGEDIPDVSLYDHSRMTSAIATALYYYHKETGTMNVEEIKKYDKKKFLIINGDFYGIQDFIFSEGGSTGKASAKLLRGRSFYISLFSELAADMLCNEIGLPVSSVILNAAGKFTILAYNTEQTKDIINKVELEINDWLIKKFYGQASMGIVSIKASCDDFVSRNFPALWERLSEEINKKKYSKIDLNKYGGNVEGYLDSFNNELDKPICPFCGKRPSLDVVENDKYITDADEKSACDICRDHIFIGTNLVKNDRLAITTVKADIKGEKLKEPIYGNYQLAFTSGKLSELSKEGSLLKYWDIGISDEETIAKDITAKFISGYIPKYRKEDEYDDRLLGGKRSEDEKLKMIDMIEEGVPKTFNHIANKALNFTEKQYRFQGIEALGILKADVDNLGLLFACGLPEKRQTLSRFATLSRQINNFFSVFMPYKLKTDDRFKDIYTVFAGGDDLFLIGPWNRIVEFSDVLHEKFSSYTCLNPDITISAGINVNKPGEPVTSITERVEEALEKSKSSGRNKFTLYGETVSWEDFKRLNEIRGILTEWIKKGVVNNAMLYRFNAILKMAKEAELISTPGFAISIEDMECLKWQPRLKYSIVRNAGKDFNKEERTKVIDEVLDSSLKWLNDYKGKFKVPL